MPSARFSAVKFCPGVGWGASLRPPYYPRTLTNQTRRFCPFWSLTVTAMTTPEKPIPKLREIKFGRFDKDPSTLVLTVTDSLDGEYRVGIAPADAGHLVGGVITSVGKSLDVDAIQTARRELTSTKVIVSNAGIGFGDTAGGPVVVAQVGGLTLVFTISEQDLVEMAHQILFDYDETGADIPPPKRH